METLQERYVSVVCIFNEKGKVEYVNDRFIIESPLLANDKTFYQDMFAKINREFAISLEKLIKKINKNKESCITYKSYIKDKVNKLALVHVTPLFDKDQKLSLYSLNIFDITNESLDNNKLKKLPIIDGKDILFLSLDEVYLIRAENIYSKV
ncbi:MAG: hypothetical protein SVN78_08975, partial [Deferribacterota bacterium]|nr:hypothetical protein [Deferribacterota bacterium]